MKQHNQIGKYIKKDEILNAKIGRTFLLPSGREYQFTEYRKEGRRYIFVITYNGYRIQIKEVDFNTVDLDVFFIQLENDIKIA